MKLKVVVVKDNVTGYGVPEVKVSEQQAVRDFEYGINQPGLLQFKPEDYSLWLLGEYDSKTGELVAVEKKLLAEAVSLINREVK